VVGKSEVRCDERKATSAAGEVMPTYLAARREGA